MLPAFKKGSDLNGIDMVESSTEEGSSKNKRASHDEKWLEESKAKLLKQFDDEKRAQKFMSRTGKQLKKNKGCKTPFWTFQVR